MLPVSNASKINLVHIRMAIISDLVMGRLVLKTTMAIVLMAAELHRVRLLAMPFFCQGEPH